MSTKPNKTQSPTLVTTLVKTRNKNALFPESTCTRLHKRSTKINHPLTCCTNLPFVNGSVSGLGAEILCDSGSQLHIISENFWHVIQAEASESDYEIVEMETPSVISIGGEPLKVIGSVKTILVLGTREEKAIFHILKNSHHDCLIGAPILSESNLDQVGSKFLWKDQQVPLISRKQSLNGVSFVKLTKSQVMSPRSETICFAKIGTNAGTLRSEGIFEPFKLADTRGQLSGESVVAAACLVRPTSSGLIPIKILNTGNSPVRLWRNSKLGFFSAFEWVEQTLNSVTCSSTTESGEAKTTKTETQTLPSDISIAKASSNVPKEEIVRVEQLLKEYSSLFVSSPDKLTRTNVVSHGVDTGTSSPIKQRAYRVPHTRKKVITDHVRDMLEKKIIEPSSSPWASPVVLVGKKDGTIRFCIDFRKLNSVTKKDTYPLPRIDDTLDVLGEAKVFSTLDLFSGYWQVPLKEEDKEKTAFVSHEGLYQFTVMPFGLTNAPATFQRMMEVVLSGLLFESCLVYIDDVIVFGDSYESHYQKLRKVLDRLHRANLKLKPKKCSFLQHEVTYLGHVVGGSRIKPDSSKIDKVSNFPAPKSVTEVKSFLGLCSYYRKFIKNFASVAYPLNRLTRKNVKFVWDNNCQEAFNKLKNLLVCAPVLRLPDFSRQFILQTDASNYAIGAVLSQIIDGQEHPIAFASRQLNGAEEKYATIEKEALAIKFGIQMYRPYIFGTHFKIQTDHNPLTYLAKMKDDSQRVARWALLLQEYDFEIEHRKGIDNANADALSRIPPAVSAVIVHDRDDTDTIKKEQRKDKFCKLILRKISHPDEYIRLPKGITARRFVVQNDLLYFRSRRGHSLRLVVPDSMQLQILQEDHDIPIAGHLGYDRTLAKIKPRYYWLNLSRDVFWYCRSCLQCQKRKETGRGKAPLVPIPVKGEPMKQLGIDIVGPLPRTQRKNRFLLVITDYLTKWAEVFPLPEVTAPTVAKILVEEIVCRFSCPRSLLSDQGTNFTSKIVREVCRLLEVKKLQTTIYHPQCDGHTERFNRTLADMLACYVSENDRTWDLYVPYVLFAYRTSVHSSTGFSPFEAVFAREPDYPSDPVLRRFERTYTDHRDYLCRLAKAFGKIQYKARENIGAAQQRQKTTI